MARQCEFVEGCPMFKYFRAGARRIYLEIFCQGDFEVCHRRRRRLAGEPVPRNLLPHGGTLWAEKDSPPEGFG
jgi:hypothetical protein